MENNENKVCNCPHCANHDIQENTKNDTKALNSNTNNAQNVSLDEQNEIITIDDFCKIKLRVGKVLECEKVENADKLLKSRIKIGDEIRTIVSGIAQFYKPEEMVGKSVVVVANLKPAKLRGIMSEGMILCAQDENGLKIVNPEGEILDGSEVR